ncbi:MAG: dihydroxy-acid dehydratase [Rhodospirillaceae bacterium]|jgi:dihydroxy-acid dehydratase|nr:dihydroxy-acid dehydratase [Rhodospirillaceae bacterium]MBT4114829.1 dihydroxy-acid dehydratase [Rhodospirillaceae bacterium]MBT4673190.1 dihydroxy-acid dehydratase [Rhodospirillaceae bacterium]MBT4720064.1 dihydroxy-acid dehydratase [Rhodospirillaceae bacterium]MBT4749907.1 dihydroxy-acid dehydratase [Rhodospirillaceae bacterium]
MTTRKKSPDDLRSQRWYGPNDMRGISHRARSRQMGFSNEDFSGKPKIGILNTWSDMNTCHSHFKQRVEEIKRGVWETGGFPIELPAMSLGEIMVKPSTMMYRNFLAMEAEELIRCHPIDGVVLMGGCDKTTPALLMAALTMDLPAIYMPAGPMLRGFFAGETLGSGTDVLRYWADRRAGLIDDEMMENVVGGLSRSAGTCMVMGTAATMMSIAETLGMTLPGASSIPAVDSHHALMATATGRRIVDMVWEDLKPSDILSKASFDNATVVDMALGGSTNAMIHLIAVAGRAGISLDLERFDAISRTTPVLGNIKPSGQYLMEDFYYAGGLRALMVRLRDHLDLSAKNVVGSSLGEAIDGAEIYDEDVIRGTDNPLYHEGGTAILRGNLAPSGCVIKQTAADPKFHKHKGPAVVFEDYPDLAARIDDPDLEVDENSVLVLKNAGPIGAPGMPEWGMLPIPKKLLEKGVRDMVRISDCRMSGTAYGTCILHVAPEAHVGGPLALVQNGDMIELDIPARRIHLDISDEEMAARKAAWIPRPFAYTRGYTSLFAQHVTQADEGCDFDFLHAGGDTPEPPIY